MTEERPRYYRKYNSVIDATDEGIVWSADSVKDAQHIAYLRNRIQRLNDRIDDLKGKKKPADAESKPNKERTMDHLQEAIESIKDVYRAGDSDQEAQTLSQLAIAHALIALVERLDKVTFQGTLPAIRIDGFIAEK